MSAPSEGVLRRLWRWYWTYPERIVAAWQRRKMRREFFVRVLTAILSELQTLEGIMPKLRDDLSRNSLAMERTLDYVLKEPELYRQRYRDNVWHVDMKQNTSAIVELSESVHRYALAVNQGWNEKEKAEAARAAAARRRARARAGRAGRTSPSSRPGRDRRASAPRAARRRDPTGARRKTGANRGA